ncbi:MAG: RecX family transcriptional regulator [Candidatus Limivivens sp.]|nr:RecX family transcriptional regulator [Candidatus Limivivens sp.]
MRVTGIEPAGKGRYNVYLEEQLAFILYGGELSRYRIREDTEISQELYDTVLKEVLLKRAQARSLYLLKSMDRTEFQMRRKLKEGKYPDAVVEEVIRWLYGFRYLDDRRYAANYISQKKDSRSRLQILHDLVSRGIPRELAEEIYEEEGDDDELELIRHWIEKKGIDPETAEPKEIQKLYQFLVRKGFRTGDIARVLEW